MADEEVKLTDEDMALLNEAYETEFKQYEGRVNDNLQRIAQLIQVGALSEVQAAIAVALGTSARNVHDDAMRSAVVFMHATLEDVLRTIALKNLPITQKKEVLRSIPLKGMKRGEKFTLDGLAEYRGMSVDDVIREAVSANLDQTTYNNIDAVGGLLKDLEIDTTKIGKHFPVLDAMMKRRHQIVHRADRRDLSGEELSPVEPIDRDQVADWGVALKTFLGDLLEQVALKQVVAKIRAATPRPRD